MKKTVLITGASSGLGKETAKLFQAKGWNVIATMRSPEKETGLTGLENVLIAQLDVQNPDSIQRAVDSGIARFGTIDVLVNNAGYALMGPFESATKAQIARQYDVNVFGLMDVTRALLPHFRAQQRGAIINLSSFGGIVALPFGSFYNSSKFAVEGFSEALSHELAPFNIAVKLIEPGSVATNFRNGLEMGATTIDGYAALLADFFQRYPATTAHLPKASALDVALAIYQAATDNEARLRYVVGEDAQFYIDQKYATSDEAHIRRMRSYFTNSTTKADGSN